MLDCSSLEVIGSASPSVVESLIVPNSSEIIKVIHNEEQMNQYIQKAQKLKRGIYNQIPEKSNYDVAHEITTAKDEFSQVIAEEKDRVHSIVEKETIRVTTLQKEQQTDTACPLCLEPLPVIYPPEECPKMMPCCGELLCRSCDDEWDAKHDVSKEMVCFSCRRPLTDDGDEGTMKELAVHGGKRGRGSALSSLARLQYDNGEYQKAYQNSKKAAKLGDPMGLAMMAQLYKVGEQRGIKVQKSIVKAKQLAQKGADQGNASCYMVLADLNAERGNYPEFLRLVSLAAYQGMLKAKYHLAYRYIRKFRKLHSRKDLILCIYWSGKALEDHNGDGDKVDRGMFLHLQTMFIDSIEYGIRAYWHERISFEVEPLTGCSHIPLCSCIKHKGGNWQIVSNKLLFKSHAWNKICACCGSQPQEKLKVCARCKSFHYCSKECQTKHWRAGHKVDCKKHWVESFFPKLRIPSGTNWTPAKAIWDDKGF